MGEQPVSMGVAGEELSQTLLLGASKSPILVVDKVHCLQSHLMKVTRDPGLT